MKTSQRMMHCACVYSCLFSELGAEKMKMVGRSGSSSGTIPGRMLLSLLRVWSVNCDGWLD